MSELCGIDEEKQEENKEVISIEKEKRKMFTYWEVGGEEYKLKLTTAMICKLEEKYKMNLLNILDNIPPLSVMLTIVQAAMTPWQHNIKIKDVQDLYDTYVAEGGGQMTLFTNVIMQVMAVSGFFTKNQTEDLLKSLAEADELL